MTMCRTPGPSPHDSLSTHRGKQRSSKTLMNGTGNGIPPEGADNYDQNVEPDDGLDKGGASDTTTSGDSGDIETGAGALM